jgi:hypothetical protein
MQLVECGNHIVLKNIPVHAQFGGILYGWRSNEQSSARNDVDRTEINATATKLDDGSLKAKHSLEKYEAK